MQTEEKSLEDVLGESMDQLESGALDVPEVQPEDIVPPEAELPEPSVDDALVDDAPADGADDKLVDKPDDKPKEPEAPTHADDAPPSDPTEVAPSSWKPDVAAKFNELPAEVKAEIHRREAQYHKGIEQYKPAVQFAHEMNAAITPYVQNIQASGVAPAHAINHLLMIEDKLRNGDAQAKMQILAKVAQDYGIDLAQAVNAPAADPRALDMERQLNAERQQRMQYEQGLQEREQGAVLSQIEAFAQAPGHEHFEAVKQDMGALLQSGIATSLDDAYDKAVWARADLRQSLIKEERTEAEKRALEQQRRSKAKSAAVGVKGSAPTSSGALKANASIEEVVAAAMDGTIS